MAGSRYGRGAELDDDRGAEARTRRLDLQRSVRAEAALPLLRQWWANISGKPLELCDSVAAREAFDAFQAAYLGPDFLAGQFHRGGPDPGVVSATNDAGPVFQGFLARFTSDPLLVMRALFIEDVGAVRATKAELAASWPDLVGLDEDLVVITDEQAQAGLVINRTEDWSVDTVGQDTTAFWWITR